LLLLLFLIAVLRVWEAVFSPFLAFRFFRNPKGVAGQIIAAFTQKKARKNCAEKRCRNWLVAEGEKEKGDCRVARGERERENGQVARSGKRGLSPARTRELARRAHAFPARITRPLGPLVYPKWYNTRKQDNNIPVLV